MKLHILSDLHVEHGEFTPPPTSADVVVLAGDIHVGLKAPAWIYQNFKSFPVVYVLGNHEFYCQTLPNLTDTLQRQTQGTHIHLLENRAVELNGYTFLGCTLWTDFAVHGDPARAMRAAEQGMNDFQLIRHHTTEQRFRAQAAAELHQASRAWLKSELARHDPAKTIVVTHHAPSPLSEDPVYARGPLSPAFVSNLNAIIEPSGIPLWIHGHTHFNVDYRLGATRVTTNQRGYPANRLKGFDPGLVVEI